MGDLGNKGVQKHEMLGSVHIPNSVIIGWGKGEIEWGEHHSSTLWLEHCQSVKVRFYAYDGYLI